MVLVWSVARLSGRFKVTIPFPPPFNIYPGGTEITIALCQAAHSAVSTTGLVLSGAFLAGKAALNSPWSRRTRLVHREPVLQLC